MEQRFNISTRVDDNGTIHSEVHDREKRGLFGPPFADDQLGGGILTTQNVNDALVVCNALNALDQLPAGKCSPSIIRAASHMVETKAHAAHVSREYLDPWNGFGAYDKPVEPVEA